MTVPAKTGAIPAKETVEARIDKNIFFIEIWQLGYFRAIATYTKSIVWAARVAGCPHYAELPTSRVIKPIANTKDNLSSCITIVRNIRIS